MNSGRLSLVPGVVAGLLFVLVALGWVLVRLADVQLADPERWRDEALRLQTAPDRALDATRGALLDRQGRVLALTDWLPSIALDPSVIEDLPAVLALLEEELGLSEDQVRKRIAEGGRRFVYLRRAVRDRAAVERLRTRADAAGMRGVLVQQEAVRVYPSASAAANVLGFTDRAGRGVEGAELLLDKRLRGTPGVLHTRRDGLGRRIVLEGGGKDAHPGESVRLTLDLAVQTFAEEALDETCAEHSPKAAIAAVMDVRTGELLAVAVRPTFDPNDPGAFPPETRRNRFFTDVTEPGSTFKPVVMALALDAGVVRPGDVFDCSGGAIYCGRRRIREDDHHDYDHLTATGVIARSSNVGMVQVAQALGVDRLHFGVRSFGFGSVALPAWRGGTSGVVTPRERFRKHWTLPSMAFGHEIAVTPAQILSAYATLGSDGVRRPLRLVLDEPAQAPNRVLTHEAAADTLAMLAEVMRSGTGRNVLRASPCEYGVGGKTGTAQKLVGREIVGHVGSFACVGPVEDPRLAVLVLCDEPTGRGYGSIVAAPYAVRLMRRSLRYLGCPVPQPTDHGSARAVLEVLER